MSILLFIVLAIVSPVALGQWLSATTTRYWDCNKPFCEPNDPLPYPHSYAMQSCNVPTSYGTATIFGTAAASDSIIDGTANCEKCYLVRKTGTTSPLIILKTTNWCPASSNSACTAPHFDIAAPGFDWAGTSVSNVCVQDDPSMNYASGYQVCQNWYAGQPCDCAAVSTDPVLQKGCSLFVSLNWDNPTVDYQPIACPTSSQLGSGSSSSSSAPTPPPTASTPTPPHPTPTPPHPTPTPPPSSSASCSAITPAYDPTSEWWVEVNAPAGSTVSVVCTGPSYQSISCVPNYGKFQCAPTSACYPNSQSARYAIVNGVQCPLSGTTAVVANNGANDVAVNQASMNTGAKPSSSNSSSPAGWVIAVAVIGSVAVVAIIITIIVLARKPKVEMV